MKYRVSWPQHGRTIEVANGKTLLEAALDHDLPLEHACGGYCACTTCHVLITEGAANLSTPEEDELERLKGKKGVQERSRLACQSKICGNVTVEIP
ncbi:MAG: 2Fe-2S iron-sulfur cluster binding domain-containing protein [Deltaproteobacteria bacterium]|nr:2Fe-2S iron-sulfur cluster binding domain-containing protein [Deltaproteobacteria bacterium]